MLMEASSTIQQQQCKPHAKQQPVAAVSCADVHILCQIAVCLSVVRDTATQACNAMLQDSHAKGCFTWSHSQQRHEICVQTAACFDNILCCVMCVVYMQQHPSDLVTNSAEICLLCVCIQAEAMA